MQISGAPRAYKDVHHRGAWDEEQHVAAVTSDPKRSEPAQEPARALSHTGKGHPMIVPARIPTLEAIEKRRGAKRCL